MGVETTLNSKDFELALSVLKSEQEANMPSHRQMVCFRLFNLFIYLFVGSSVIHAALVVFVGFPKWITLVMAVLEGIFFLPIIPLLFLNMGFMLKLWRQARLRKQLHLVQGLKPKFKAHRRNFILGNLWSFLVSLPGYFLVIIGLIIIIGSIFLTIEEDISSGTIVLFTSFAPILLGLSFIFLYFMRRGKQRLDVVRDLQTSLSKHLKSFEQDKLQRINIDPKEYDTIARMERVQIIHDRQRSIEMGLKEMRTPGYLIQKSRDTIAAKSKLERDTNLLVEEQILQLATDPLPKEAQEDSDTGTYRLKVPDTDVEIVYQVDQDNRRIKIFSLQIPGSGDFS